MSAATNHLCGLEPDPRPVWREDKTTEIKNRLAKLFDKPLEPSG